MVWAGWIKVLGLRCCNLGFGPSLYIYVYTSVYHHLLPFHSNKSQCGCHRQKKWQHIRIIILKVSRVKSKSNWMQHLPSNLTAPVWPWSASPRQLSGQYPSKKPILAKHLQHPNRMFLWSTKSLATALLWICSTTKSHGPSFFEQQWRFHHWNGRWTPTNKEDWCTAEEENVLSIKNPQTWDALLAI